MLSVAIIVDGDAVKAGKDLRNASIKEMSLAISQMEVIKKDLVNSIENLMKQEKGGIDGKAA